MNFKPLIRISLIKTLILALILLAICPLEVTAKKPNFEESFNSQYFIILEGSLVDIHGFQLALMNNPKIEIIKEYKSVFKGFLVEAEKADLIPFIGHPMVKAISANALEKEDDVSWALDRIDQETLPLDNSFLPPTHGNGVNIYILDSGIRSNHTEFSGRIAQGQDFTGDGNTHDCSGHGTGVAALAAGSTLGVASQASIIPIKVTPCGGGRTSSMIVNGLDWILDNFQYPGELLF